MEPPVWGKKWERKRSCEESTKERIAKMRKKELEIEFEYHFNAYTLLLKTLHNLFYCAL